MSEVAAIFRAERIETEARQDAVQVKMDARDVKLEQQRKEMEANMEELTPAPPTAAITDEQLTALYM